MDSKRLIDELKLNHKLRGKFHKLPEVEKGLNVWEIQVVHAFNVLKIPNEKVDESAQDFIKMLRESYNAEMFYRFLKIPSPAIFMLTRAVDHMFTGNLAERAKRQYPSGEIPASDISNIWREKSDRPMLSDQEETMK